MKPWIFADLDTIIDTYSEKPNDKKNCDNCVHYHWYQDWCDKWKCEVDARSIRNCYEARKVKK